MSDHVTPTRESWPVGDVRGELAAYLVELTERGLEVTFRPFQLGGIVIEVSDGAGSASRTVSDEMLRLIRDREGALLHMLRRAHGDVGTPDREP